MQLFNSTNMKLLCITNCSLNTFSGSKFVPEIIEDGYKVHMRLRINSLSSNDYGVYKCISKNSLGDMEGSINVYSEYIFVIILFLLFHDR